MRINIRLLLLSAAWIACLHSALAQEFGPSRPLNSACSTPNNRPGTCVLRGQCLSMTRLITKQPMSEPALRFFRLSYCGFQGRHPIVCCDHSDPVYNIDNPWE